jgi:hypothetical protein
MKHVLSVGMCVLTLLVISACSSENASFKVYVVTSKERAEGFIESFSGDLDRLGFRSTVGTGMGGDGRALRFLEARRRNAVVFSGALPISQAALKSCGSMQPRDRIVPRQFIVTVDPRMRILGMESARKTYLEIKGVLAKSGYEVLERAASCSFARE